MVTFNEIPFGSAELSISAAAGFRMRLMFYKSQVSKNGPNEFTLSETQMGIVIRSLFKKNDDLATVLYSDDELIKCNDMEKPINSLLHSVEEAGRMLALWDTGAGMLVVSGIGSDDLSILLTALQAGVVVARLGIDLEMNCYVNDDMLYAIYGSDWKPEVETKAEEKIQEKSLPYTEKTLLEGIMDPKKIKKMLDKMIIGQDSVKEKLATAVYQQEIAVRYNTLHRSENGFIPLQRKNILMYGPSGSGKTAMITKLAAILDRPVVIFDSTALTPAGYHGKSVDSVLYELVKKADGDTDKASRGIVYLDEWDKAFIGANDNRDMSSFKGEAASYELLRMMDGCDVLVDRDNGSFTINTENILFILGGAFSNLDKIVTNRITGQDADPSSAIGFMNNSVQKKAVSNGAVPDATIDDLKIYGIPTEILGRITTICRFKPLNRDDLVNILAHSEKSPLREYTEMFKIHNVSLQLAGNVMETIAEIALQNKLGARGLVSVLEKVLMPVLYNVAGNRKRMVLQLRPECFTKGAPPVIMNRLKNARR